jgi:6,7-dimethyl-8-ribityllumazine synthase
MTRIAIVAAAFNKAIVEPMIAAAHDEATKLEITVEREVRVPGSLEIPLVTAALLAKSKIDAVVVLGYLEKGETLHGEVIGHVVYRSLLELSIAHAKPIGLGIIGPGATLAQAETRKDRYARAAVQAALASVANLVEIETKPKKKKPTA